MADNNETNPLKGIQDFMEKATKGLTEHMTNMQGLLPASQIVKTRVCTGVVWTQEKRWFGLITINVYTPQYANVTAYKQANGHIALDFENPADADKFVK